MYKIKYRFVKSKILEVSHGWTQGESFKILILHVTLHNW